MPASATLAPQRTLDQSSTVAILGAHPQSHIAGQDPLPGKVNYFLGNNPTAWRTDVPTYAKVAYQQVYPGARPCGAAGGCCRSAVTPSAGEKFVLEFRVAFSDVQVTVEDLIAEGDKVVNRYQDKVRYA